MRKVVGLVVAMVVGSVGTVGTVGTVQAQDLAAVLVEPAAPGLPALPTAPAPAPVKRGFALGVGTHLGNTGFGFDAYVLTPQGVGVDFTLETTIFGENGQVGLRYRPRQVGKIVGYGFARAGQHTESDLFSDDEGSATFVTFGLGGEIGLWGRWNLTGEVAYLAITEETGIVDDIGIGMVGRAGLAMEF